MSSSNFCINFCCSLTLALSSSVLLSAASSKAVFSFSLTCKWQKGVKIIKISTYYKCRRFLEIFSVQCLVHNMLMLFQCTGILFHPHHTNFYFVLGIAWNSRTRRIHTFNCVSSCSIFRFLSRRRCSILLISSPPVAASQSSASIEL